MRRKILFALALAVLCSAGVAHAQQMQPLTFVSDYTVRSGKEEEFTNLVKTVGAPVRDKLMAEGVVLGWGLDVPLMRAPGQPSHSIWYTVADWDGVEKVQTAMAAQLARLAEEDKKAAEDARKKGGKAHKSTAERIQETLDSGKTRDWLFRETAATYGSAPPPPSSLPYSRVYLLSVRPGRNTEWRQAFDKYIAPTLNKLVNEGVLHGWALGVEEVKTSGDFTHFVWVSYPGLAAAEKLRNAFAAVQLRRSPEENEQITQVFTNTSDQAAARSMVLRAVIFKIAPPPSKK